MTRSEIIQLIVLAVLLIGGIFVGGFPGGVMTGSSFVTLLMATVGKLLARKAAANLDKSVRDIISNKYQEDEE
jgi:flagellar biosynthesis component FlhA